MLSTSPRRQHGHRHLTTIASTTSAEASGSEKRTNPWFTINQRSKLGQRPDLLS